MVLATCEIEFVKRAIQDLCGVDIAGREGSPALHDPAESLLDFTTGHRNQTAVWIDGTSCSLGPL